jgi:hypothetical protein
VIPNALRNNVAFSFIYYIYKKSYLLWDFFEILIGKQKVVLFPIFKKNGWKAAMNTLRDYS